MSIYAGIDIGATSTTTVTIDDAASLMALHLGSGANPFAFGGTEPLQAGLRSALAAIETQAPLGDMRGLVIGLAGLIARPAAAAELRDLVADLGLEIKPLVVHDAETMFASGTSELDGSVLVAGTGAIAMAIRGGRSRATVDGHGWLLGDEGSAVWMGRATLRGVLRSLDRRGPGTSLVDGVVQLLGDLSGQPCAADPAVIVRVVHELPRPSLGRIAILLEPHAEAGDGVARSILDDAVQALTKTLTAAVDRDPAPTGAAIVIGGSVAHGNAIIRRGLERAVRERWPAARLKVVLNGAAGAALWARRAAGRPYDDEILSQLRAEIETYTLDRVVRH